MKLTGCIAIVTGGASGIGASTARRLTDGGARCVLIDRNSELGTAMAAELGGVYAAADVNDESAVQAAVGVARTLGPIRVLINAAGIGPAARTIDRQNSPMPMAYFERVVRVNLLGTFNCIRLVAAAMAGQEPFDESGCRGSIINVASVAAFDGQIGQAAYSASKGGVVGMTLPIARDLANVGIRVNSIAPGIVDTPIYGAGEKASAMKDSLASQALFPKRPGTADELASLIVEVATNDYMNAETIRVDGGIRMASR